MRQFKHEMRRMPRTLISAAVVSALLATSAQAAVLANVDGAVSVNDGGGFQPATEGAVLAAGERIRTGNGSAEIVYDNGCSMKVGPQQAVAVLSSPPPCNGASLKDGLVAAPAETSAPVLLGGLIVVGGAIGLAVALSSSGSKQPVGVPVSP